MRRYENINHNLVNFAKGREMGFLDNTKNKVAGLTAMAGVVLGSFLMPQEVEAQKYNGPLKRKNAPVQNQQNGTLNDGNGNLGLGANGGNGGVGKAWSPSGSRSSKGSDSTKPAKKYLFDNSLYYVGGRYDQDNGLFTKGWGFHWGGYIKPFPGKVGRFFEMGASVTTGNKKAVWSREFTNNFGPFAGGETYTKFSSTTRPNKNEFSIGISKDIYFTNEEGYGLAVTPFARATASNYPAQFRNILNNSSLGWDAGIRFVLGAAEQNKLDKISMPVGKKRADGTYRQFTFQPTPYGLFVEAGVKQETHKPQLWQRQFGADFGPNENFDGKPQFYVTVGVAFPMIVPKFMVPKYKKGQWKPGSKNKAPAAQPQMPVTPPGTQTKPVETGMIDAVIPSGNLDGLEILDLGRQPKNAVVLETAQKNKADVTGFTQPTPAVNNLSYSIT
jgi:hypothetical protein